MTPNETVALVDDHVAENKTLTRKLVKHIAIRVAVGVAIHFATEAVIKALESKKDKQTNSQ